MIEKIIKLSKLILEKGDRNVTIPNISEPIKVVSQVPLNYTTVKYRNIFRDSSVKRFTKFQTTVGYFVFELLNTMKNILNRNDFYISLRKKRN